jgi:ATP-binding cassette subfamily B protein
MAMLWAGVQVALAAWARISNILNLESNLKVLPAENSSVAANNSNNILEFKDVSFHYADSTGTIVKNVLEHVSFELEKGKTYALVGPTGGGKTTTASLIARLYDPVRGGVFLKGKDIRTYDFEEKAKSIGFILQDPIVFPGTLKDNIAYGNPEHEALTSEELLKLLKEQGLDDLLERFEGGLDTPLPRNTDSMSLGQKQILAFVRAVLRKPDLLILDEATANIDTVTEQVLDRILEKLPKETTKVIIAHRLNTIQNADVIYFVNNSTITRAGSIDDAVNMLLKGKKTS